MSMVRYPTPFGVIVLELKICEDSRRAPQHGRYSVHVEASTDEFVSGMQAAIAGHGFTHESEMRAAGWAFAHNILVAGGDPSRLSFHPDYGDLPLGTSQSPLDLGAQSADPGKDVAAAAHGVSGVQASPPPEIDPETGQPASPAERDAPRVVPPRPEIDPTTGLPISPIDTPAAPAAEPAMAEPQEVEGAPVVDETLALPAPAVETPPLAQVETSTLPAPLAEHDTADL